MFTVELYARIRRAVMVNGLSRREAARRSSVHRNTISKIMLLYSVPPGSQRVKCDSQPGLRGPFLLTRLVYFHAANWHNLFPPLKLH